MKENIEERACRLAVYMLENRATVRAAAQKFGISKSTVHKDLSERLPLCNRVLYDQVKTLLERNKAERHIRGGMATRNKFKPPLPFTAAVAVPSAAVFGCCGISKAICHCDKDSVIVFLLCRLHNLYNLF